MFFGQNISQEQPRGLGVFAVDTSQIALDLGYRLKGKKIFAEYASEVSRSVHPPLALRSLRTTERLLIASYVLTELASLPDWWLKFEALAIIEPSTQDDSRALMSTRQSLIENGYHIWAPCTHQGRCPQLTHSARDWCHDRIHWRAPKWFADLENHLPMKNRTLTFSYLLARRSLPPPKGLTDLARLTGDMLEEKGKTRQSLCRGTEREFLAWFPQRLAKGEDISLERGSLVRLPENIAHKASELRVSSRDSLIELSSDEVID
jgi:hypothetical protein